MQLGGIGNDHDSHTHQVTGCMHEHTHFRKTGASSAGSAAASSASQFQAEQQQLDAQFSLSAWLDKALKNGRKLWQGIWGSSEVSGNGESGETGNGNRAVTRAAEGAAGALTQGTSKAALEQQARLNVYFREVEQKPNAHISPVRRLRVKLKEAAAKLSNHLPGHFLGAQTKNSFQAKQQQPKEDLSRRSKYRKDELEIDCVLTDESYLMDSYDRKGEYSQLTTKK